MERLNVSSSNLSSVGYDSATKTLEIEFNNGRVYQYYNVPESEYDGLMKATSKGKYLDRNIVKGGYKSSKV
jgi:hypothetical protein